MKSTLDQIKDIKNHGYTLDFSTVFNNAFENYKKIALYAGLILLVFSIVFGIIAYSILAAIYGIDKLSNPEFFNIQTQHLSQIKLVYYVVGTALFSAILSPFAAGFLKMAECADKDEEFNVSTIFTYYKTSHFFQIFIATLLISLFGGIISTFLETQKLNNLGLLISLAISYFTFLTIPLIVFGNLKAITAIQSSFIIISKQPFVLLGLMITIIVALLVGFLALFIGILFTVPLSYSMTYAIYYAIFKNDKEDPIDSIGQSGLE
ncbi:hypothetical protein [Flavobacterium aquidurense]|uniref:Beta-carotene 15,15'-monooxygenase n=1 Tax=Flavobacterium aquidurense TaxID=362413 RepID=A0A0Q0WU01_9FLAO|nr:hypothetical protein [Flavobacterium aquidurense]KQB39554.1 hypothetical protein RC62_1239 [Flavobacterium aquidurense]